MKKTLILGILFLLISPTLAAAVDVNDLFDYGDGFINTVERAILSIIGLDTGKIIITLSTYLTSNPNIDNWPIMKMNFDLMYLIAGGYFVLALVFSGVKYLAAAGDPTSRAFIKKNIKGVFMAMVIVIASDQIWRIGVSLSDSLTAAMMTFGFEALEETAKSASASILSIATVGLCVLSPFTLLILLVLLVVEVCRQFILVLTYALFPIGLGMYFAGVGRSLGKRVLSLYLIAILSNPLMCLFFSYGVVNLDAVLNPPSGSGIDVVVGDKPLKVPNAGDTILGIFIAIGSFVLSATTPLLLMGLMEKGGMLLSAVAPLATIGVSAIATPAAGILAGGALSAVGGSMEGVGKQVSGKGFKFTQGLMNTAKATTASVGETAAAYGKAKHFEEKEKKFGTPKDLHTPLSSRGGAAKVPNTGGRSVDGLVGEGVSILAAKKQYNVSTPKGLGELFSDFGNLDPKYGEALKIYNQQSGNYTDLDHAGKPTSTSRVIDWTQGEGNWDTEGRKYLMQNFAGGGLVELSGDGGLNLTGKGREALHTEGVDTTPLEYISKQPCGFSYAQGSYEIAKADGAVVDEKIVIKSPTHESMNVAGKDYNMHIGQNGSQYQVVIEGGRGKTIYSSLDSQEHGINSPQELTQYIQQTSTDYGLRPEQTAVIMNEWKPVGKTRNGMSWEQDQDTHIVRRVYEEDGSLKKQWKYKKRNP